jgi:hypothetical protein
MAKRRVIDHFWLYRGKKITSVDQLPKDAVGFIYIIRNESNGKFYVGRKSLMSTVKKRLTKAEKLLPGNSRKTFKTVTSETNWLKYTGSCKPLNEDIKKGNLYEKEILQICYSKKQLSYYEIKHIVCVNCLEREDCYNQNLLGKFFPSDLVS